MVIYAIQNEVNTKCYIGQSSDVNKRWSQHKSDLRADRHYNNHLQYSWNKYGEDSFEFKIIEEGFETINELNDAEAFWIKILQTHNDKSGYNLELGGNNAPYTHKRVLKLRKNHYNNKKVHQYTLEGKFIKTYRSCSEAARQIGIGRNPIIKCANNEAYTAKNYIWSYTKIGVPDKIYNLQHKFGKRKVYVYDLDGKYLFDCNSINEASIKTNTSNISIRRCLKGKLKKVNKYQFKKFRKKKIEKYKFVSHLSIKVSCYNKENLTLYKKFNSIREAARYFKCSDGAIRCALKGKTKTSQGYIWKYD